MAKIVIDANIIISAAFGGKPLETAVRAMSKHKVYISQEIKQELITVFSKLSKKLTEEQLATVREKINKLIETAALVDVNARIVLSRDAKDDHYLSLCKEIGVNFLITGDKDLLSIPRDILRKEGIQTRIVNPHEFLEEEE
ncbi:MAG: putative toxin-antitoxin system toxin component, PIN family [Proteobacteria bacterium]|nr:putative toxin-antitoxin system toxin component, PIN family [Pseudomonadota bacterium]